MNGGAAGTAAPPGHFFRGNIFFKEKAVKTPEQEKGQPGTCETMKIKADNEQGYVVINEDDFDASKHERFEGSRVEKKAAKTK